MEDYYKGISYYFDVLTCEAWYNHIELNRKAQKEGTADIWSGK